MILILISIIVSGIVSTVLLYFGKDSFLPLLFGFLLSVATGITALVYAFIVWQWIAAEHKAKIINREYKTNYTQAEIFYASDVIETIRNLDRNRYEVNGNLMQKK